jgi:protein-S-isoprenylcysteine O-methyltransferase Ste14
MRFSQFRTTKTYDLLVATPLILWYLLGIYGQIPALLAEKIAFPLDAENLRALMHVIALVTSFLFVGLIDVLLVIRTPATTRSHGFAPRAVAFAHAFMGVGFLRIAPAHISLALTILSWALSTIGSAAAIVVSLWLGRSFSIMPEARRLITRGPYRIVRHPLYLAEAVGLAGITLQFAQPWSGLLYLAMMTLMILRMGYEERVLGEAFPEYRVYAARTARLIPGIY